MLTIQPDLTTTTTSYQGTLRSRHDATGKFSMTNGPLLDPLPNGSHTLHNGKLNSDPTEFVSRLSMQSYFKTLPRDVANTSYGTFNFLGGRLTIPSTGEFCLGSYRFIMGCFGTCSSLLLVFGEEIVLLPCFSFGLVYVIPDFFHKKTKKSHKQKVKWTDRELHSLDSFCDVILHHDGPMWENQTMQCTEFYV